MLGGNDVGTEFCHKRRMVGSGLDIQQVEPLRQHGIFEIRFLQYQSIDAFASAGRILIMLNITEDKMTQYTR